MRAEIEQAVELLQRGDDGSLERALGLLQNTVFSFSMRVCGQREDAEDTMQEVLLKSVPQLSKFDNPRALLVWLYKVAKSRCLMSRRRSCRWKNSCRTARSSSCSRPTAESIRNLSRFAANRQRGCARRFASFRPSTASFSCCAIWKGSPTKK